MRFLSYGKDGGKKSTVSGLFIIEIKSLFSIVLLRFDEGSREAYHNHAFNAYTWFLKGDVDEHHMNGDVLNWKPSWKPKYTPRDCFHKVFANKTTYAFTIRGPWKKTWQDFDSKTDEFITYSWGRKQIKREKLV